MTDIQLEQVLPGDIERRSFEIIQEELSLRGIYLEPENEMVIKRAIHTTADFDYAQNLVFSGQAVKRGTEALKAGAVIVTDTNMGLSGINKKRLSALGGEAFCFMADEDVALQAKEQGTTRAVASMEKAARLYGLQGRPLIFAVGNAPTALVRIYELIEEGLAVHKGHPDVRQYQVRLQCLHFLQGFLPVFRIPNHAETGSRPVNFPDDALPDRFLVVHQYDTV